MFRQLVTHERIVQFVFVGFVASSLAYACVFTALVITAIDQSDRMDIAGIP